MRRYLLVSLLVLALPLCCSAEGVVVGTEFPITWTASPTPQVRHYRLYVSQTRGAYNRQSYVAVPAPTTQAAGTLLGLTTDGQYYLVATAATLNGESKDSNEVPFVRQTAIAPPQPLVPDLQPPVLRIITPTNGSTVARGSSVTIKVEASDNVSVTRIVFAVNKTPLPCVLLGEPYQCQWKVPNQVNATYTINAQAIDQSGNNATTEVEVTAK